MTSLQIEPSTLNGQLTIPPSKSQSLRAILFGALAKGKSRIENFLPSPDSFAMMRACRAFGAKVEVLDEAIQIEGLNGQITGASDLIDAGNSGIVLRFASAVGTLGNKPFVVTGDASIRTLRPMKPLIEGLRQLGAFVESIKGDDMAPLIIKGALGPGEATIDGRDSQPVSGLLIASAFVDGAVSIRVEQPGETPWVGLTLDWFTKLGIDHVNNNFERYSVPRRASYDGFRYSVPGDLSTASFPIGAALVTNSEVTLHNVDLTDPQGDKELIFTLQKMGAKIEIDQDAKMLIVKKGSKLHGIDVDINSYIDAVAILAVIACFAEGTTRIRNAQNAMNKESNRITAIVSELKKMKASIAATDDGLIIQGSALQGASLFSHNDHRIAMSLAVAAMGAKGHSTIQESACIAKSYPTFLRDFQQLGARIQ